MGRRKVLFESWLGAGGVPAVEVQSRDGDVIVDLRKLRIISHKPLPAPPRLANVNHTIFSGHAIPESLSSNDRIVLCVAGGRTYSSDTDSDTD
jgi:hypothetical protein